MAFQDITGNARIKKILVKALQRNKVPNSLLFCGPEGVGKRETAMVLAKALNCRQKDDDACEACSSCRAVNGGKFPDVIEVRPEENVIKIEQMRELRSIAYLRPMVGRKRVFVVVDAEKMSEEAANSLLKILEEPPPFSHIILIAHNPFLILPTIKSRCQVLNFQPVSREDVERVLLGNGYEREKAKILSLLVRGNLRQALSLEWEEVQAKRRAAYELFLSLLNQENVASFLRAYTSSHRSLIKEEWEQVLEVLSSFCRDLILIGENGRSQLLMNPDYEAEMRKAAGLVNREFLLDLLRKIEYIIFGMGKSLNMNLLVSSLFLNDKEWEYA